MATSSVGDWAKRKRRTQIAWLRPDDLMTAAGLLRQTPV